MTAEDRLKEVEKWEPWRKALWEERAAIIQFDGKVSREEAELWAFEYYRPRARAVQRSFEL